MTLKTSTIPIKIFICYARKDEALLDDLKMHLKPLERRGQIDFWHDRDINGGTEWKKEIDRHLNAAQIILLLVSPHFMGSDYCYSIEMQRSLERHKLGEVKVIPIVLRPTLWQDILGNLQALPRDAKPVTTWQNQDEAFYNVAEGIQECVEEMLKHPLPVLSEPAKKARLLPIQQQKDDQQHARQAAIRTLLERLIQQTPGLDQHASEMDYIRFGVEEWDMPSLLCAKDLNPSPRLLPFVFINKDERLKLQLGLAVTTQQEIRRRLFEMAAHQPPFKIGNFKKLPPRWIPLYDHLFLAPALYELLSNSALEREIDKQWRVFLDDLEKMKAIIRKQQWIWKA